LILYRASIQNPDTKLIKDGALVVCQDIFIYESEIKHEGERLKIPFEAGHIFYCGTYEQFIANLESDPKLEVTSKKIITERFGEIKVENHSGKVIKPKGDEALEPTKMADFKIYYIEI